MSILGTFRQALNISETFRSLPAERKSPGKLEQYELLRTLPEIQRVIDILTFNTFPHHVTTCTSTQPVLQYQHP